MGFMAIFHKPKSKIYGAEQDSVRLNKEIFNLLLKCEKDLGELKNFMLSDNSTYKDAKLAELENNFLNMRSKIDAIRNDMQMIFDVETQNKDYIGFNDDFFIRDKMLRLDTISKALDELLELTHERPTASELKGMVDFIYGKINILIDAVNNIINDDRHLESTYSKIDYL